MKNFLIVISIGLIFASCKDKEIISIPFTNDSTCCDGKGIPKSNSEIYFPRVLFKGPDMDLYLDVFKEYYSNMLYKLNEPILYHGYLGNEVYRMIASRAFDQPLIVRIEIHKKHIILEVKKVERFVTYPFRLHSRVYDSTFYDYPNVSYYDSTQKKYIIKDKELFHQLYNDHVRESDSLLTLYRDPDYRYVTDKELTLKIKDCDPFFSYITSTGFWKTYPDLNLGSIPSIDGSHWIFEGHSKYGYQVKMIANPDFDKIPKKSKYLTQKIKYAELFSYILSIAQLPKERKY